MFFRKRKHEDQLFSLQDDGMYEDLTTEKDDRFFEEAFRNEGRSALEPTKSFVGTVILKHRLNYALVAMTIVFFVFAGQASALQIFQGEEYRMRAERNRTRQVILPAERGVIYDRNGKVLADNIPTFRIVTTLGQLPYEEDERRDLLNAFAQLMEIDKDELYDIVSDASFWNEDILLADGLSYNEAMKFAAYSIEFPNLHLEAGSLRRYITDEIPSLSHVLGYTAAINDQEFQARRDDGYRRFDHLGKLGLESTYETWLRGTFGAERLEVDALGRTERVLSKVEPVNGQNLTLTIDADLQAYTERVLDTRMEGTGTEKASVVIMNPSNGEVLTLVSWPAYDANLFTRGIDHESYQSLLNDENRPMFARAFAGEFPSGSTVKPAFSAAALIEGIITPQTVIYSYGGISVGPWRFPDWKPAGHGPTNVYHAIADSVNTFYYMIAGGYESFEGMGIEKLMRHAANFGFGEKTGIDLPGEARGFLPSPDWKWQTKGERWYIGDTYNTSIGQGDFLSTPLQVAQSTAIFANNGVLMRPHLAMHLQVEEERIIDEDIAQVIKDGMRRTVTQGTGQVLQNVPVSVAGKTGTAQWSSVNRNHTWFTGFAPYEDPTLVITVLVEEGADDYLSVMVTHDILNWWFSRQNVGETLAD